MTSVGTILKKEREKRKLSLNNISEETKIGIKYLKAIEADDYTIFPGETYIVGFIRNYARALGLDPLEIVSLYKSMKVQSPIIEKAQPSFYEEEGKEAKISAVSKPQEVLKPRRRTRKKLESEPVEIMEINEKELPTPKLRRKKIKKESEAEIEPITPVPLKGKKFVNPIVIITSVFVLVIIFLLGYLIRNIIIKITTSEKQAIYTELSEIKYLEFDGDVLKYDFAASEYYKIKLGDKFHTIMFEQLTPAMDITKEATNQQVEQQNIAFHFDDIILQIIPGEEQSFDFDLDGVKDINVKINSINKDLFNASIKKLHPFIVAMTTNTNQTNVQASVTNNNAKKEEKENKAIIPPEKRKIVFEAIVRERTYIKAFLDGKEQEGKIYYPKDKVYFEAKDVMQLKIGNAGGIIAKINGKIQKLGRRGEIANKVIKWEKDPYDDSIYNLIIKDWQ